MNNKKFYGLYCGYSQSDIEQMKFEVQRAGITALMDNYVLRKKSTSYIMEDKWEAEPPRILQGSEEKIVLDAICIEYTNEKSKFQSFAKLLDYMVEEEKQDMESYIRHEMEWEY